MVLAEDYPFLDVLWTLFIFFLWVIWFWLLFTVFIDVFGRHDVSGRKEALWPIFVIIVPSLCACNYLDAQNDGMTHRKPDRAQQARAQFDQDVREVAGASGGPAAEIDAAKKLLDQGAMTHAEFETIKQKALAT